MTSYAQWTQWLCEAWLSSIVRAITVGGVAIGLFWIIDRCCRSLSAMQRSWLWRLLYIKLALLLVCSSTFLAIPVTGPMVNLSTSIPAYNHDSILGEMPNVERHSVPSLSTTSGVSNLVGTPANHGAARFAGIQWGSVQSGLMIAWTVGVLILIGHTMTRYFGLIRWLRRSVVPTDAATESLFRSVARDLRIAAAPRLRLVKLDCSPCLLWDRRAYVVLPADFMKRHGNDACRMAMAHELGHFVRRDLQWNALVSLVSTWLFFFPLVWLMNRRYRMALEMACDAYTIDRAHVDRHSYANLLVGLLDSRSRWAASTTSVAMAGSGSFRSLSTRLNAMKFQKQGHFWLRRLSLCAAGCAVGVSLLPWGFAGDDETKKKKASKSNKGTTTVESTITRGVGDSSNEVEITTTVNGQIDGKSTDVIGKRGSGSSSGSTSASSGRAPGKRTEGENVMITTNSVDGKRTMLVNVASKDHTILIREGNGVFQVDIDDLTRENSEPKGYVAKSRIEFVEKYPEVFARIKKYLEEREPQAPVAPVRPVAPKLPKPGKQYRTSDAVSEVVSEVRSVEGLPLSRSVLGVPLSPSVPTGAAVPAVPAMPAMPAKAVTGVPLAPAIPALPAAPAVPAIKGVIEALEKIRLESAGNAEIERLIESIKEKLDDRE